MLGLHSTEERSISTTDLGWGSWGADDVGETWSGMKVDRDSSLQLLAVHGSVRMISESIAVLPPDTYRRPAGVAVAVPTDPPPWIKQPSLELDWIDFVSQVLTGLLLDGNSYIQVISGRDGMIRELIPIADERVSCQKEGGRKVIRVDGQVARSGEVKHIPAMMLPGAVKGLSPIEYARQVIGLGLGSTQHGAEWFDRDGNMPGIIELPRVAQPDVMRKMAKQWRARRSRSAKGEPGVLDDGASWKPTGVTNEQMQFLETRQWTAAEISGQLYLLDPTDLGIPIAGSSLSYANLEQRSTRRVQVTLLPWIVRLEKAFSELLVRGQYLKLNVDGILRGDAKSRYEAYKIGIENGFLTVDEVREMEDRAPISSSQDASLAPDEIE